MDDAKELRRTVIAREIERQLASKPVELMEDICQGLDEADSLEVKCAKMVRNGIVISINIAADLAIGMMVELGIAEPKSEDELRRSIMSVIK
ncbi:hypothetical protein [uncultured Acetatifactor sp.]|jgi:hypothetical protein|uniref:hypothetical protein n=1 Tax=uncultured Acetatifactor sp. TaxID=1671927 RepID=UPI00261D923E|nr:hypothetical protein [uncultured Acetatifactor sp.]